MPSSYLGSGWEVLYPQKIPVEARKSQKASLKMTDDVSSGYEILLMSPWNEQTLTIQGLQLNSKTRGPSVEGKKQNSF